MVLPLGDGFDSVDIEARTNRLFSECREKRTLSRHRVSYEITRTLAQQRPFVKGLNLFFVPDGKTP